MSQFAVAALLIAALGPCNLPTTHDLIIWQRAPRLQDSYGAHS
ncbi:MAG TPA: hypothetical protein VGH54_14410 [Mycobacterium sp.]|jgi:hypothetical protein